GGRARCRPARRAARHPLPGAGDVLTGRAVLAAAALVAGAAAGFPAAAAADCLGDMPSVSPVTPKTGGQPLEFGIYPGGPAGQIVVSAPAKAEDPSKML